MSSEGKKTQNLALSSASCIEPLEFRRALSCYPTGVCIVTSMTELGKPLGMTVGTFTSVSLEPPLVGFFPAKNSASWSAIRDSGRFCINVLAADQQEMCGQFASKDEDKFAGVAWVPSESGLPVISGVLLSIDCDLESTLDTGDHLLALGHVRNLVIHPTEMEPLIFVRGKYTRTG